MWRSRSKMEEFPLGRRLLPRLDRLRPKCSTRWRCSVPPGPLIIHRNVTFSHELFPRKFGFLSGEIPGQKRPKWALGKVSDRARKAPGCPRSGQITGQRPAREASSGSMISSGSDKIGFGHNLHRWIRPPVPISSEVPVFGQRRRRKNNPIFSIF